MAVCDGVPGHVCGAIGWSHWLTWLFFHYDAEDGLQPLTFIIHRWTPVQSVLLAMNLALVVLQITGGSLIVHTCSHIPGVSLLCFDSLSIMHSYNHTATT